MCGSSVYVFPLVSVLSARILSMASRLCSQCPHDAHTRRTHSTQADQLIGGGTLAPTLANTLINQTLISSTLIELCPATIDSIQHPTTSVFNYSNNWNCPNLSLSKVNNNDNATTTVTTTTAKAK